MAWFVGQSAIMIVAAFALGLLVGWLWWHRPRHPALATATPAAPAHPAPPSTVDIAPADVEPTAAAVPDTDTSASPIPEPVAATREAEVSATADTDSSAAEPMDAVHTAPADAEVDTVHLVDTAPADAEPVATTVAAADAVDTRPGGGGDEDLRRIEGIGPKMAGALNAAGIRTFRQLADADEATLRAAIEAAGLRFAPSLLTWSRQARLLADGDEGGFTELTARLIAGRDVPKPRAGANS